MAIGDAASPAVLGKESIRQLHPQWNSGLIAASIAISLLGAFTSTQLMCQARASRYFVGALVWTMLGSLTFGFCSIWSLHEVAMLACELDLPIGIDVPLTIFSSILAVAFTFAALASDLLWDRYKQRGGKQGRRSRRGHPTSGFSAQMSSSGSGEDSSEPLLESFHGGYEDEADHSVNQTRPARPSWPKQTSIQVHENGTLSSDISSPSPIQGSFVHNVDPFGLSMNGSLSSGVPENIIEFPQPRTESTLVEDTGSNTQRINSLRRVDSDRSVSQSSSYTASNASSFGLGAIMSIRTYQRNTVSAKNACIACVKILYAGCTPKNIFKGFSWSIAITSMHYVGIWALLIPAGYFTLNPFLVVASELLSWIVCLIGVILMAQMETHLTQQFLFSAVATTGVAAMHFTGMRAATFWSYAPPSERRGYPPSLATAIGGISITTCIAANVLLAHSATVSRNKLAEIVATRKKLWKAIAQKESAETAAAARSEFIASASHEIRTPLHHLQGYSDLLSRTELTEEGRLLLHAIQRATRTLSLITNNVLDWSRLESDGEAKCRPVALDMRAVCESTIDLLPQRDDDLDVDMIVVVRPNVPHSLLLDETYIQRILMNLLSNALKFTTSGYVLLLVEMKDGDLVATVKDTGYGIPPTFLPELFEPFRQAQTMGSQRGTGLGLSIIKHLLQKMQGTIEVQSKFHEAKDVGPGESGSTFTIKIPIQAPVVDQEAPARVRLPRIAVFQNSNVQAFQALCTAWEMFDYEVVTARRLSDISDAEITYVWVDLSFLKQNPTVAKDLMEGSQWLVLVSYDTHHSLKELPKLLSAPNVLLIQKPLVLHSIVERLAAANQLSTKSSQPRLVRFASHVNVHEADRMEQPRKDVTGKGYTVLLVEDNPINRTLAAKMLTSLGYQVLVAEDGQDAIDQLVQHDQTIDIVLMDQSMPRKDGLEATREIRTMENAGKLARKRPIIAVTAVVSNEAQLEFKLAGTDVFLAKPLSMVKLEETLAAYLPVGT